MSTLKSAFQLRGCVQGYDAFNHLRAALGLVGAGLLVIPFVLHLDMAGSCLVGNPGSTRKTGRGVLAYLNASLIFWDGLHPTATDGCDLDTTQAGKR